MKASNIASASTSEKLLETFRATFVGGRFLMSFLTCLLAAGYLYRPIRAGAPLEASHAIVLGCLIAYQFGMLTLVHLRKIERLPTLAMLILDLTSIFLLIRFGAQSLAGGASLGLLSLVIMASSLFYGLRGGALSALSAVAVKALLLLPYGLDAEIGALRDFVPHFLLTGFFTGFLVDRLRTAFARYEEGLAIEQRQKIESEVLLNELDLARHMQRAALPAHPPTIPGLEISAVSLSAREVGGDFHLFLTQASANTGRVGLVVGDVTGKGIPAALAATSVAHLLPWLAPLADAARAFEDLNSDVRERLPVEAFVTMVLADVDTRENCVRVWTAGHPPALRWDARAGCAIEAKVYNPYLGLLPSWAGVCETWPFRVGDVIVLYSDGLSEMRDRQGKQFGTDGAARALSSCATQSADAIAAVLIGAATEWGTTTDDLTLLVCKRVADPISAGAG